MFFDKLRSYIKSRTVGFGCSVVPAVLLIDSRYQKYKLTIWLILIQLRDTLGTSALAQLKKVEQVKTVVTVIFLLTKLNLCSGINWF